MTINEIKEKGLLLFECISGSKAYGLNTAQSDTDLRGVYYLPKAQFYGLEYIPQISNETSDEVYYELGRFVELLIRNNPNILEVLASPEDCILFNHPIMNRLSMELFMSKLCKETFAGYALTQIKKARGYKKKIVNPVAPVRKTVLDFCFIMQGYQSIPLQEWLTKNNYIQEHCGLTSITHTKGLYALFYDATNQHRYRGVMSTDLANEVSLSSIPKGEKESAYLFFNLESYSSYCKEYREYWEWVEKRNETRYQDNSEHGKGYDAKNMMHTIRLLQVAEEILREGKLNVKRANREELLSIKTGQFQYDDLLVMADSLMQRIETAYENSPLPAMPDKEKIESILVQMREELYG
ncbi:MULTISPECIES: DNA polymerase beta superfamily protein [Niastella]|uniref:Nucleotidyltransferase domain-containing protein n=1 Tax=Niastella soli TaxID=2821487 RepID=A0ABS3YNA2_9BACT|nr:nucleotidyltransferase domain-containing protein [Niastella soli]MBO9199372.1 nucleotidyltransferase domain-containing protein [Niastella soli]